jgi:hypothetical protein
LQAFDVYRTIGDLYGEGNALFNLSVVLNTTREYSMSITYAERAQALFEQIDDPRVEKVRQQVVTWKAEMTSETGPKADSH